MGSNSASVHVADYIDDAIGVRGRCCGGTLGPGGAESTGVLSDGFTIRAARGVSKEAAR